MYSTSTSDSPGRGTPADTAFARARNERDGFLRYFGFRESPFGVSPDPGFLFFSRMHRAALDAMIYSIESNLGFTVLLGSPGTGKTTLLYQLLTQYRNSARTAFIFQTQCKPHDLLRYIASEFELPGLNRDEISLHRRLEEMLLNEAQAGRRALIIIDEAQNLHSSSLEAIRLLSDFETASAKLLHVVLAGSSRLAETLLAPELSPLAQRVLTVCRLEPFTREEVKAYVSFRLATAGGGLAEDLFSPESLAEIAERGGGVPRVINSICYRSLSLAYATGQRCVSYTLAQQAVRDLDLSESRGMDLQIASHPPRHPSEEDCGEPGNIVSNAQTASEPCNKRLEIPQTESALGPHSQPFSAGAVANSSDQLWHSPVRKEHDFAIGQEQPRVAATTGVRSPSGKRIRVLKPAGLGRAQLNDFSSIVMGALLLLAFGAWSTWHELRPKFSTAAAYRTSIQPEVVPPESRDRNGHDSPGLRANLPIVPEGPNRGGPDYTVAGAIAPRPAAPVIQTLPDALLPSKIGRSSFGSTDPAVPNNMAALPNSSDPLINPLANIPSSVPQLKRPAVTSEPMHVTPASFLHPTKVVRPEYPNAAKLRHIEGDVVLELEIDAAGTVEKVRTVSGHIMLREAAEEAARQWQYPPLTGNQIPVPAVTQVRFNFRLDPKAKQ